MPKRKSTPQKPYRSMVVLAVVGILTAWLCWNGYRLFDTPYPGFKPNPYIVEMDKNIKLVEENAGEYTPMLVIMLTANESDVLPPAPRDLELLKLRKCYLESKGWYVDQDGWGFKSDGIDKSYYVMAKENPVYAAAEAARLEEREKERLAFLADMEALHKKQAEARAQDALDIGQFAIIAGCKEK